MNRATEICLLQVRDLAVTYQTHGGASAPALMGVSLSIHRGETVGLLGESGCGKSTLAASLLGLLPLKSTISSGSILWDGRELRELKEIEWEKVRGAEIALISQDPTLALDPVKRVGEQVADVVQAHRPWKRKKCREEAELLLESMHLKDVLRIFSSYPFQLSGGQLQRIVIAQALACQPSLVVADEPTSALDPIIRAEILGLFCEIQKRRDMAILFISHEPEILSKLADRIVVMKEGKILEEGTFAQLRDHPATAFTRELLAAVRHPSRSGSRSESGSSSHEGCDALTTNGNERK